MNRDDRQRIEIRRSTSEFVSHENVDVDLRINSSSKSNDDDDDDELFSRPKTFIEPIIEHQWNRRSSNGHLVVSSGDFVAYVLKPQSGDDIVCVFYKQVDFRSVIDPPFRGDVRDLAFSYSTDLLLSCVDQTSQLRIYRIEKLDELNQLEHTLIFHLDTEIQSIDWTPIVTWCCFIPDTNDDENDDENDASTLMSLTIGSNVEVFNVEQRGQTILRFSDLSDRHLTFSNHNGNVTCVCFSPDGTALATATDQGEVKFFSINFQNPNACRCLNVWIPHEGRPISSLFFLDDHLNLTQETQLWRYAITACENNREFKLWSCTNWTCLQILRFVNSPIDLKVSIDLTSRFLVLSDLQRKSLYVLTIRQDDEENRANFSSIHVFPQLSSPSLSLTISVANELFYTKQSDDATIYAVKIFSVQPRCFQQIVLVMKTKRFTTFFESENFGVRDEFRFEILTNFLRDGILPSKPIDEIRRLTEILRRENLRKEKLEKCCEQIDELTFKVDRLINTEENFVQPREKSTPVEVSIDQNEISEFLREKIPTTMNSIFEPYQQLKDQLHKDLAAKLLATDTVMKQTISQMFRSKNSLDSLAKSVSQAVQTAIVTTYRDTFNQSVIPAFEKTATNMFQQTNDVFKRGTKEYFQEMIEYGKQQQQILAQQREQMSNEIKSEFLLLNTQIEEKNRETIDETKIDLTKTLVDAVRSQTSTIFREVFEEIVRQPTLNDLQKQRVVDFLRQRQLNRAFEFALSASDLSLVLFVCEQISAKEFFSIIPCPLKVNVLLSLIQQLSSDLTTHQQLKCDYLSEALLVLDFSHSNVREHLQTVLIDLTKRLTTYLQTHPPDSMTKRFQLLWMTSQGLVQKLIS